MYQCSLSAVACRWKSKGGNCRVTSFYSDQVYPTTQLTFRGFHTGKVFVTRPSWQPLPQAHSSFWADKARLCSRPQAKSTTRTTAGGTTSLSTTVTGHGSTTNTRHGSNTYTQIQTAVSEGVIILVARNIYLVLFISYDGFFYNLNLVATEAITIFF